LTPPRPSKPRPSPRIIQQENTPKSRLMNGPAVCANDNNCTCRMATNVGEEEEEEEEEEVGVASHPVYRHVRLVDRVLRSQSARQRLQ
jgi:hypothetical protein